MAAPTDMVVSTDLPEQSDMNAPAKGAAKGAAPTKAASSGMATAAGSGKALSVLPGPEVVIPPGPDLLAFKSAKPTVYKWAEQQPWKGLSHSGYILRGVGGPALGVVRSGWNQQHGAALEAKLREHEGLLRRVRELPPCGKPRTDWSGVLVVQPQSEFLRLLHLSRAVLLKARWAQWKGRPDAAVAELIGALRLSCHLSHVPSLLIRTLALLVESQAAPILREVEAKAGDAACKRLGEELASQLAHRSRVADLAAVVWLEARANLHTLLDDSAKSPLKEVPPKRWQAVIAAIRPAANALFRTYLGHVQQGLKTSREADWKTLDAFIDTLRKALAPYKLRLLGDWNKQLSGLFLKHRDKPASWMGELVAKLFLKITAVGSGTFKRSLQLGRKGLTGLRALAAGRCGKRKK